MKKGRDKTLFCYNFKSLDGKFLIIKSEKKLYAGLWHLPMIETNDMETFKS